MKINKKLLIIVVILIIVSSCGKLKNPQERNTLIFKDDINSVFNAIQSMNTILINSEVKNHFFYAIDDDNILYADYGENESTRIGSISDIELNKSLISFISLNDRERFLKLASFLFNNHFERCGYKNNRFIYIYRSKIYMADRQKDLMRYVMIANSIDDIELYKYKILDTKGNLFLLADKNAEIYEN